jgi:hypothetical protein
MFRVSQPLASANVNFSLKNDSQTIVVDFMNNYDIDALLWRNYPGDIFSLHFENLRGNDLLPVIDVYMNLEDERAPEDKNYVGSMALYGLSDSSANSKAPHGPGQHRVFDVGQVFRNVSSQSNWSKKQFSLTLIPYRSLPPNAILTIGLITVYFNES